MRVSCLLAFSCIARADDGAHRDGPAVSDAASALFANFPTPDASAPFVGVDDAWPMRWSSDRQAPGVVHVEEVAPMHRPSARFIVVPDHARAKREASALLEARDNDDAGRVRGEGAGAYVVQTRALDANRAGSGGSVRSFRCVSLSPDPHADHADASRALRVQTTVFSVFQPTSEEVEVRGTALLMPGMFGTPEGTLSLLTSRLRARGWVVVRMMAQPSRFSETVELRIRNDDPESGARWVARETTDRIAECAYACRAVLDTLESIDPRARALPRVVIGMSMGAITLPGVVALEPERYAACVLIGGGCDMVVMTRESNYTGYIDALRMVWDRPPTREEFRVFDEAYLRASPLDAFHASAALRGRRVLMIHGSLDQAVPAPLGDVLWERMGRPRREVIETGHEGLFLGLPGSFDRIAAWLEEATCDVGAHEPGARGQIESASP